MCVFKQKVGQCRVIQINQSRQRSLPVVTRRMSSSNGKAQGDSAQTPEKRHGSQETPAFTQDFQDQQVKKPTQSNTQNLVPSALLTYSRQSYTDYSVNSTSSGRPNINIDIQSATSESSGLKGTPSSETGTKQEQQHHEKKAKQDGIVPLASVPKSIQGTSKRERRSGKSDKSLKPRDMSPTDPSSNIKGLLEKIEENSNSDLEVSSRGSRRQSSNQLVNKRQAGDQESNSKPSLTNSSLNGSVPQGSQRTLKRRRNSSSQVPQRDFKTVTDDLHKPLNRHDHASDNKLFAKNLDGEFGQMAQLAVDTVHFRRSNSSRSGSSAKPKRTRRRSSAFSSHSNGAKEQSATRQKHSNQSLHLTPPKAQTTQDSDLIGNGQHLRFSDQGDPTSNRVSVENLQTRSQISGQCNTKLGRQHKAYSEYGLIKSQQQLNFSQTVSNKEDKIPFKSGQSDRSFSSKKGRSKRGSSRRQREVSHSNTLLDVEAKARSTMGSAKYKNRGPLNKRLNSMQTTYEDHSEFGIRHTIGRRPKANSIRTSRTKGYQGFSPSHAPGPLVDLSNMSEFELVNQRALTSLQPIPDPLDKKKQLSKAFSDEAGSIEGDMADLDLEEAPKIRKYLERHADQIRSSSHKTYSLPEVKEYRSIKSVLSQRSQFNTTKQEFHQQLARHFIVQGTGEHLSQAYGLQGRDEKTRKRTSESQARRDAQTPSWFNIWARYNAHYKDTMLLIKDDETFIAHGKRYKFTKNGLGFLHNKMKFRCILVWIITWPVFEKLILILIILNSLCLGAKNYLDPTNETDWNKFIDSIDIYFTVAFCIECSFKILAMGFAMGKGAYLRDVWNWLDFLVVTASLLETYMSNLSGLRVFRLFRPLRSLNNIKSMQILVETLFRSMMSLGGIMGLAIFFFIIFAILGISQWRGLSHYRCRLTEFPVNGDWQVVPDDLQLCGEGVRECPIGWCGSLLERDLTDGDLYTVDDLYRDSNILELNFGVTNFDQMGSAFLTIFQCITMEGWTSVMYIYQDVFSPVFVTVYFIGVVIICSFFLLNLTIAVMLMQYDELEQKNSNSFHKQTLRQIGLQAGLPFPLIEFIIKQSNLSIGKAAKKRLQQLEGKKKTLCQKLLSTEQIPPEARNSAYYSYKAPRVCFAIAKSNAFGFVVMVCIILNTAVLSMDRYPGGSKQEMAILGIANQFFNIVFTAEVVIKMVGLGLKRYINVENVFDLLVVSMSWIELILGAEGGSSFGALRAVRLFRVFKLFKSGDLRILMDSIVFTISTIGPYTVLLMLFLYVFALMGMQFFAGQFRFLDHGEGAFDLENGEVPRLNFDTLRESLLTTFVCFIGDNWTYIMYDAMRSTGSWAAIIFVIIIAFGNIVMLNLFLAILLGNFDRARDFGGKVKLLNCFIALKAAGHDLSQSIDYVLEDTAEYIKFTILRWDKRIVQLERDQPSRFMRTMLAENATFMDKMDYSFHREIEDESSIGSSGFEQSGSSDSQEYSDQSSGTSRGVGRRRIRKPLVNFKRVDEESSNNLPVFEGGLALEKHQSEVRSTSSKGNIELASQRSKVTKGATERALLSTVQQHAAINASGCASGMSESQDMQSQLSKPNIGLGYLGVKTITSSPNSFEDMTPLYTAMMGQSNQNVGAGSSVVQISEQDEEDQLNQTGKSVTDLDKDDSQVVPLNKQSDDTDVKALKMANEIGLAKLQSVDESQRSERDLEAQRNLNFLAAVTARELGTDRAVAPESEGQTDRIVLLKDRENIQSQMRKSEGEKLSQLVAADSPKKGRTSLFQSISNLLSKSKRQEAFIEQKETVKPKKVLLPCGQTVRRTNETKDLKALIQASKEYVVEREDYYAHEPAPDQPDLSMIAHETASPSKLGYLSEKALLESSPKAQNGQLEPEAKTPDPRMSVQSPWLLNRSEKVRPRAESPLAQMQIEQIRAGTFQLQTQATGKYSPKKLMLLQRRKVESLRKTLSSDIFLKSGIKDDLVEFQEERPKTCCQNFCSLDCLKAVKKYMGRSSLLIFHQDCKIRQLCLKLLTPAPKAASKTPKADAFDDPTKTQIMSNSGLLAQSLLAIDQPGKSVIVKDLSDSHIFDRSVRGRSEDRRHSLLRSSPAMLSPRKRKKRSKSTNTSTSGRRKRNNLKRMNKSSAFVKGVSSLNQKRAVRRGCCTRCLGRCCPSLMNSSPNKWFDNAILMLIFTSSVMLVLDNPLNDPDSMRTAIFGYVDFIHTVLFTCEMMIKIIGLGFFTNKLEHPELKPYMRSSWNVLDFFVVMSSLLEIVMPLFAGEGSADSLQSLKALRALRALRPLRMVSKNEGMKLVVGALMTSIPSMTNVLVVCMLLLLILAIVGVNLFKGTFFSCGGLGYDATQSVVTKEDCVDLGGEWANQDINFDNVVNAMMTLFQMMTTEGWTAVMYNGVDSVGVDMQPKKDEQPLMALYFVAFMIIGSQFIINLFVGVVIDNFNKIKEADEMGGNFVTQEQRSWIAIQKVCLAKNLVKEFRRPKGYQMTFTRITESMWFEYTITTCIILNTVAMGLVHYRQSEDFSAMLENLNYVFAFIFNVEMVLKLLAQGRDYFRVGWNVFDCFIVFGTNFGLFMKVIGSGSSMGATTSVIRGFRIMRIFRLVKASIALKLLIDTILNILPQITNIMSLMGILLFIYAALGINLFSAVMLQDQLNEKNNFQNFENAMVLLMRCATGEDWNLIMYELANTEGYDGVACRDQSYEEQQLEGMLGCGTPISYVYFFSFIVIITMLIINLSVAAVIQGLDAACQENLLCVTSDDVAQFIDLWKYFDPMAKGWIGAESLVYLLYELDAPLGRKKFEKLPGQEEEEFKSQQQQSTDRYLVHAEKKIVIKKVKALAMLQDNLKLKMHKDASYAGGYKVHYMVVLRGLLKRILSEKKQDFKVKGEIEHKMNNMWTKKHKELKVQQDNRLKLTAGDLAAVRIIEEWFQKRKRNTFISMKEANNNKQQETDRIKEAQRQLAMERYEHNRQRQKRKGMLCDSARVSQSGQSAALVRPQAEAEGNDSDKNYDEQQMIEGGRKVLKLIRSTGAKEAKWEKMASREESKSIKYMQRGKFKIGTKLPPLESCANRRLTWTKPEAARGLLKQVENEERRKGLIFGAASEADEFDNVFTSSRASSKGMNRHMSKAGAAQISKSIGKRGGGEYAKPVVFQPRQRASSLTNSRKSSQVSSKSKKSYGQASERIGAHQDMWSSQQNRFNAFDSRGGVADDVGFSAFEPKMRSTAQFYEPSGVLEIHEEESVGSRSGSKRSKKRRRSATLLNINKSNASRSQSQSSSAQPKPNHTLAVAQQRSSSKQKAGSSFASHTSSGSYRYNGDDDGQSSVRQSAPQTNQLLGSNLHASDLLAGQVGQGLSQQLESDSDTFPSGSAPDKST